MEHAASTEHVWYDEVHAYQGHYLTWYYNNQLIHLGYQEEFGIVWRKVRLS